jgi:hypothetical protein
MTKPYKETIKVGHVKLAVTIDRGNAAFEDDPDEETERIIDGLAYRLDKMDGVSKGDSIPLFDINGNKVGSAVVKGLG